jgi:hypothetical protein
MIPNRDSIPQNQPRPKEAVSKTAGAATSINGISAGLVSKVYARFMGPSFVSETGLKIDQFRII